ncbi:nucleotidyl transferase AbiEii/AbiGii toxin family protein [Brevibacterium paucivorans]|uniref:nucleotidyl transferase AbiEii/AbiGii toxin family protein n=1 Tax=Brevibacterium paucivorans TaxID=170994 RepID=UPI002155E917|nr:nucleotidyl transferase AbiEii/AbiGii toxin family protein [Brevibacterium paucivorans]
MRIFKHPDSEWFVKGGTALLAREPLARETRDIDLATCESDFETALVELQNAVQEDAGDHLRMVAKFDRPLVMPTASQRATGGRLMVTVSAVGKVVARFGVDMVVSEPPIGEIQTMTPRTRLHLPRPVFTAEYRLYPIADQIADKIYATVALRKNSPVPFSTRVKDLVDLAIYARTQTVYMRPLRVALKQRLTALQTPPTQFSVPEDWRRRFGSRKLCTPLVDANDYDGAVRVATELSTAVFDESVSDDAVWTPEQGWTLSSRGSG